MRIGIVAPSVFLPEEDAARVAAIAAADYPDAELIWHPQIHAQAGHFAGPDSQRAAAFVEFANREDIDAIWFARGGYGAGRIAPDVLPQLTHVARRKLYMGYSDGGYMLGLLYRAGFPHLAHGPMVADIRREGGEAAVRRALDWLVRRDPGALEPGMKAGESYAAFNLLTLAMMVGTPLMPDISHHVLMVEDLGEYLYSIDRAMFAVTTASWCHPPAEIRLGRISEIRENDRPFGTDEVAIAQDWCARSNIRYGGRCDIGHDIANKVVPFGRFA